MNDTLESRSDLASGQPCPFPIVGIGASAGGLEAFRRLLGALPSNTGMAYVLVQHLDPHHDSILAELLSEITQMEVAEVTDDVRVEPNRVYVIPPAREMVLVERMLRLEPRGPPGALHMPIDSFLRSLAEVQGAHAIGVILSGMGTDGTLGLRAIEAAGGIAFAQEPTSAQSDGMPRSAISSGCVDFVLNPEDIASELKRLGQHPYLVEARPLAHSAASADANDEGTGDDQEGLARILQLLHKTSGTDFSAYKKTTLRRRIARRMAVSHIDRLRAYALHVEGNAAEATALYEDCLISVTSFFRDPEVFATLSERILPTLLRDRPSDTPLRVWVPGCATGEEVYSIAMCLLERMAALAKNPTLQIFATDLSEGALQKAREGSYLVNIARDVSAERLRRFFTKVGDHYQISKAIREMCVFARHDLTRDPPYSRLDLVSCRNVLIYLEPRLQELVLATFHYALRPDGFLVVGSAETVGASAALFSTVDEKRRIYSRSAASGAPRLLSVMTGRGPSRAATQLAQKPTASEVPREADRLLLARFGPAGVVVDESLRVLEFRGDTAPYLDHGHGKATLNLQRLVRKGLLMELRGAVAEARRTDTAVRKSGLQVRHRQKLQSVSLEVIPIKGRAAAERCLLVLFEAEGAPVTIEPPATPSSAETGASKDLEIERLGQGLAQTTEYVHTLVREHESALEELQSTTEEALSSNEELQSLNEELQTAKEEIQSVNEELATLNQELQDRNAHLAHESEVIQRGLDSANELVDTVPGPLVILDGDLRIEKGNAAFYAIFKTQPELARGRLLVELGAPQWGNAELNAALKQVLAGGAALEDLEIQPEFLGIGQRTMRLNARRLRADNASNGRLLLAIEDRTEIKRAELGREELLRLEHEARTQAEAADQLKDTFVATASHELRGPLTVISGWMNILQEAGEHVPPATLKRALAAISRGVAAQGRLISELLDHSQLVAGKVELRRAPIDLVTVAEAALVGVRAAAETKDIDVQLSPEGSCIVLGDFDRMQQVMWNLFLNAVKFTPPGGFVRVSVGRVGHHAEVRVSDTGCGISRDFLPHVFDRFRQAEGSTARIQPGLGLGLTLVRELVELHGGTVSAESAGKDQGSTFTLLVPIPAVLLFASEADSPASSIPPQPAPAPSTIPPEVPSAPLRQILVGTRVLVVDDEPDARDALVGLLEHYGAEVRAAASVSEAMAALQLSLPDVLISDLGMPGEDGYDLIRRVRQLPADGGARLPSLVVSAYATEEHRQRVMASGFQRHLEKPVAAAELVVEVARLAGRLTSSPAN